MAINMTLTEVLNEVLKDDDKISKYEARVIRELIMADDYVSQQEKEFLEKALQNNHFDEEAFKLLSGILLRAQLKK